jgi:FixJ family two-component response regulator
MPATEKHLSKHLVVVDGDPAIRSALTFSLELGGFAVDCYSHGEALLQEKVLPAEACLIIDYDLPGINGLHLLRALRALHVTSPAILIATNPTRRMRAEAEAAGAPIVEKPLLTEDLEKRVRMAFEAAKRPVRIGEGLPA